MRKEIGLRPRSTLLPRPPNDWRLRPTHNEGAEL
jgi:hypothetical protein